MASNLPVVGVLSEGVCDLVDNGRTGFLLDGQPMNEEEMVVGYRARLERLVADEQLRIVMSNSALLEAQKHSWHDAMEHLMQGYREVIAVAKSPVAA
jgi:glycosyltransferase involved in cell wall biosynthesis